MELKSGAGIDSGESSTGNRARMSCFLLIWVGKGDEHYPVTQ
jgi:hypothetical protein